MSFDKWFNKQSKAVQIVLLLIPVVGWVVEILVRLSVAADKKDATNVIVFIVFLFVGWTWILCIADLICVAACGRLMLTE